MKVIAHPDPFVLEDELLRRIAAAQATDPLARVVVIVPTSRLARHVIRRLAERDGARLAVEVLHHRSLALRILEQDPRRSLRPASGPLLDAILDRAIARCPGNPWTRFLAERPGARRALLSSLTDLREAGVDPVRARTVLHADELERGLAEIFAEHVRGLDEAEQRGHGDDAALVRAAAPLVSGWSQGVAAVLHHGAYELIGVHLDLVRAIHEAVPVTFLLPADPGRPAFETATAFAERHILDTGEKIERIEDRRGGLAGARLSALYDEESAPYSLPEGAIRFDHVQGALAEATLAARRALAAVAEGCEPAEVAILARDLAPYGAVLDEVFRDEDLPWTTSLRTPLRRDPATRDLLLILRVVAEDFPRAPTCELLASPRLRWDRILPGVAAPGADAIEIWSRKAGILGGLAEWTRDLPAWAAEVDAREDASEDEQAAAARRAELRAREARQLASGLAALARRVAPERARSWEAHVEAVASLVRDVLSDADPTSASPGLAALLGVLEDLREASAVVGDTEQVPFATMLASLERAVDGCEVAARAGTEGVQVLDAMQSRGLTFRRSILLGFHAGSIPRPPRPDPLLRDDARRRLREATLRPVPLKEEGEMEERGLLAHLLGCARDSVAVSWQRADEAGRSKAPSLALREVARLCFGSPSLERADRDASMRSAHPEGWIDGLWKDPGLLSAADAELRAALRARDVDEAERLLTPGNAAIAPGLRLLRATEGFGPGDPGYDGRVGRAGAFEGPFAVSALSRLGRCPLQFFFRDVLRVRELREAAEPFGIDPGDLGGKVHAALETAYRRLAEEGLFDPARAADLPSRGAAMIEHAWEEAIASLRGRLAGRVPVLWRVQRDRWLAALEQFVAWDLTRISAKGLRPVAFETVRGETLDLGRDVLLHVSGRFDRILEDDDGSWIGDYKTSRRFATATSPTEMLRGRELQVPLYRMMAGKGARVELLRVRAVYETLDDREEKERAEFEGFDAPDSTAGFLETLRVLLDLARSGSYPLNPGDDCTVCAYRRACRRNHPPTLERRNRTKAWNRFLQVQEKDRKAPMLPEERYGDGNESRA